MSCCSARCKSKVRLQGKTAVVTGCNTGIGRETAKDLYKRGCRVIMACRDVGKAEDAAKKIRQETAGVEDVGMLIVVRLDLSSFASVRQCAAQLLQTEPSINLLINNAGLGVISRGMTEDGYELVFAVNHLGHFLLTLLLLPRLLTSTPVRIVNVSSVLHKYGSIDFDDMNMEKSFSTTAAYSRSKLANVLFTQELTNRLKNRGVTTYSVHPGGVNTDIYRNMDSAWCPGTEWIFRNIVGPLSKTAEEGAQTTIYCAVDEALASHSGQYYSDCKKDKAASKGRDPKLALKLWDVSLKMVDLENYDPFTPLPYEQLETGIIVVQPKPTSDAEKKSVQTSSVVKEPVHKTSVEEPVQMSSFHKEPEHMTSDEELVEMSSFLKEPVPVHLTSVEEPVQMSSFHKEPEQEVKIEKRSSVDQHMSIPSIMINENPLNT